MANAPTDGTTRYIKLGGDITSSDSNNDYALTLTNADQNVVLDLAGYTISRSPSVTLDETIVRAKEGTLTINDSVGTGGISSNNNYINSVIGLMADGLYNDNGTIIINGGSYTVDISSSITSYAIYQARGNLVINGGNFTGDYGLDSVSGKLTVYGGEFHTTKYAAILLASITNGNLYNLTAYGDVRAQSGYNLWNFIHDDGEVFVDGVKQAKTETTKFSGNKIVIKTDVLDEIWITSTAPVVGNSIPNSIDVPYTSDYEIVEEYGNQVIAWMVDGQPVNAATFAASTAYTLRVYVKVNAPTAFNFGAKVNDQPASLEFEVETMEGYKYYWVEYTFPATIDNVIPSANVTVTAPVAGETATAGVIFDSEKYNVSIGWSTTADGSAANDFNNQTFVAGNTYYVDVYLVAENPYIFADGATVFVNGTSYTSVWTIGADYKKYVAVYDIPFTVPNAETYTVSFNANGGTGSMPDETDQLGGLALPECGFTAPAGKQFKCWAEGSVSGDQYAPNEEYDVTGNVTFFAVWEDNLYQVIYQPGEASGNNEVYEYEANDTITFLGCDVLGYTCEGFELDYWSIRILGDNFTEVAQKRAGETYTLTTNIIAVAMWKEIPVVKYNVSFNANGGTGTMQPVEQNAGSQYTLPTCTFTAPDGKIFKAWSVNDIEKQVGDQITINANTVVKAVWEDNEVIYSYCTNGAEGSNDTNYATVGEEITLDDCMFTAPAGKRFKAWAIGSVNGEQKQPGQKITITEETYIYAIWEDIPHECVGILESGQGATCTVDGWKDYYRCECGKYYEDANCTIPINDLAAWKIGNGKILAAHSGTAEWIKTATTHEKKYNCCQTVVVEEEIHEWNNGVCSECEYTCQHTNVAVTKKEGQAATCTVNGWKDYYQCTCGKYFADEARTAPIADLEAWKVGDGKILAKHEYGNLIPEKPAVHTQTELQAGMRAHYYCSECGTYFDSSKNETTQNALIIPAPTHSFGDWVTDDAKHWKVCGCGLKSEENSHDYTDNSDMTCNTCGYDRTVPHTHGNGVLQSGQAATCTVNGWKDYYKCSCGKIYTDVACSNEITSLEEWKNGDGKLVAEHTYGSLIPKVIATCSATGMEAHYECSVCHTLFDENKAVKTENELTIDIDANAHTYGAWTSNGNGTHSRVCSINGDHKETVACSGGTATCTEKAVCSVCNTAYGNTLGHSHGSEWQKNADEHWNECACGDKANKAAHTDENNDGKCDICDYAMGTAENPEENIESEKTGLSGGAIAGIAVGSVAVVGLGGFSLFWFGIKKKKFADLIALFKKK